MKNQLQGIALILFSILMTITFESVGWEYVGDLSLNWVHIFMLVGIAGLIWVFIPERKDK